MSKPEEKHHRKKGSNPLFLIFRALLSLSVMLILGLVAFQAFRSFTNQTPLSLNPQEILREVTSSDNLYRLAIELLSFDPGKSNQSSSSQVSNPQSSPSAIVPTGNRTLRFAVVTDSHNDNQNLAKALSLAKASGAQFIVGLGDYTNVGTLDELKSAKAIFDDSGLPYYSTAGDHDLWDSRNRKLPAIDNYQQVFGFPFTAFGAANARLIILYNSDNYLGLDAIQKQWLIEELTTAKAQVKFIFSSIPFNHLSSDHVYGKVTPELKVQVPEYLNLFKQAGVSEIISGDTHAWSRYTDPQSGLKMTTIGAVTSERNTQSPRFALVDVFETGQYTIQDVEIR